MQKLTSVIVGTIFIVWILPLGAFIKPEKEKEACNGQRAICLCKKLLAKQLAKNANKTFLKAHPKSQTQKTNSSSSAPDFMFSLKARLFKLDKARLQNEGKNPSADLFTRLIEHVPKA